MQAADGLASTAVLYEEASRTEEVVQALQIGAVIPDFTAETSQGGEMEFYVEIDGKWSCFLSFYKTFDPVASSEMAALAKLHDEFTERGVTVVTSCPNTRTELGRWVRETEDLTGCRIKFPLVCDPDAQIANSFGLVHHGAKMPIRNLAAASVVVVADPERRIRFVQHYSSTLGRNFEELIRVVDGLQLCTRENAVCAGVNWRAGDDVFINNDDVKTAKDADERFPGGYVEIRDWFRLTAVPEKPEEAAVQGDTPAAGARR